MEKELLEDLKNKGYTSREIAEKCGKGQTTVMYWMRKYGLDTKRIKNNLSTASCAFCGKALDRKQKYCSNKCHKEYQYKTYIESWKRGDVDGSRALYQISGHIRRYLFEKYKGRCCDCGWHKKNPVTGKSPLQINHINGKGCDHREENLELICPNCHSLTPTYMALNAGNADKERLKYFHRSYRRDVYFAICEYCKKEFKTDYIGNKKIYCSPECGQLAGRKVIRPTLDELTVLIKEKSFTEIGKMLGVSDNAVRKWARRYKLI